MKRLITIAMVIAVFLSITTNAFAEGNTEAPSIYIPQTLSGKTELSLSANGKNLFENESVSTLDIQNISITNNSLWVTGNISYNGNTYPINLQGNMYKTHNLNIVISAVDSSQNFDVAYFAIENITSKTDLFLYDTYYVNDVIDKLALKLYLFRKDTRELTMFEAIDIGLSGVDVELLPQDQVHKIAWFCDWVEGEHQNDTGGVQPRDIQYLQDKWTYKSDTWYIGENWVRYGIIVTQHSNVNDVGTGMGEQTSNLVITRVAESNNSILADPQSAYYRVADTTLFADVGAGYTFYQYKWNAFTTATLGLEGSLDASISLGIPNTPMSVNLSLGPIIENVSPDNWETLYATEVNGVLKYPKKIKIDFKNKLANENHFYAFSASVSHIKDSGEYDKRIKIRWEFTILERDEWGFYSIVINDACWNQTTGTFS